MATKIVMSVSVIEDGEEVFASRSVKEITDKYGVWNATVGRSLSSMLTSLEGFNPDCGIREAVLSAAFCMHHMQPLDALHYAMEKWDASCNFDECYSLDFDIEKLCPTESEENKREIREWLEQRQARRQS